MSTHTHARAPLSHRSVALFAIAGLHAAFILAFTHSFVHEVTPIQSTPIKAYFPQPQEQPPEQPFVSDPVIDRFVIRVPTPLTPIDYTPEAPWRRSTPASSLNTAAPLS